MADDEVGSLGQETLKLLRALAVDVEAPATDAADAADGSTGTGRGEHVCTTAWCPVCQVVGYVKTNPEVVEEVAAAALHLARTVRDAFDAALGHDARGQDGRAPDDGEASA